MNPSTMGNVFLAVYDATTKRVVSPAGARIFHWRDGLRQVIALTVIVGLNALSAGCVRVDKNIPFEYWPSAISPEKRIPKTIGFDLLVDKRPRREQASMKDAGDVAQRVTAKLAQDFDASRIFQKVHYPSVEGDVFVISGTIRRFSWKLHEIPLAHIPLINYVTVLGFPLGLAEGITDIQVELRDRRSGQVLGSFSETSKVSAPYNFYDVSAWGAGMELAESFRHVAEKLKRDVVSRLS